MISRPWLGGSTTPSKPQEGDMSDQDTAPNADPKADENPADEQQQNPGNESQASPEDDKDEAWDPERARRKITKVNSENKALRERATAAEEKAASVDDLTRTNTDLSTANLRLEVGYELGLPLSLAKRLTGATKEEMIADAEALVELVSPSKRPPSNRPTERLRGGGDPDKEPEETDLKKIGSRMFQH